MPRSTNPEPANTGTVQPVQHVKVVKPKGAKTASKRADHAGRAPNRNEIDAGAHFQPQDKPRDLPATGPARLDEAEIETVSEANWKTHAAQLAFMEESVTIIVQSTNDKNAEPFPFVGVNGRNQYFERNKPIVVKRKFVEKLARTRETSFTQERYQDSAGNEGIRNVPHSALKYPFSILRDDNPRGAAWIMDVLRDA